VLFTPITTVAVAGENPGAPAGKPDPFGIVMMVVDWALARGKEATKSERAIREMEPTPTASLGVMRGASVIV